MGAAPALQQAYVIATAKAHRCHGGLGVEREHRPQLLEVLADAQAQVDVAGGRGCGGGHALSLRSVMRRASSLK